MGFTCVDKIDTTCGCVCTCGRYSLLWVMLEEAGTLSLEGFAPRVPGHGTHGQGGPPRCPQPPAAAPRWLPPDFPLLGPD